jgi:tight adherence protein C
MEVILQNLPFILGGIAVLIAIGLVAVGFVEEQDQDTLTKRLESYGASEEGASSLEEIEMSVPFAERVLLPVMQAIARFVTRFTPQQVLETTQHQIDLAGNPKSLTPAVLWTLRIALTLGLSPLLGFVFLMTKQGPIRMLAAFAGGAVVGFLLPPMWLRSRVSRRQQAIIRALPDALDLLTICVEAGLGFDAAMSKVYEKWSNDLAMAFGRVLQEIQLGKTRREALRDIADRMEVPDMSTFVAAIIQADQLGVSIAKVLRIQSDQMRVKRRQRAQEKAQQAPVKMVIPLVLLVFPSIWIVLLGPAGIQLFEVFGLSGIGGF